MSRAYTLLHNQRAGKKGRKAPPFAASGLPIAILLAAIFALVLNTS